MVQQPGSVGLCYIAGMADSCYRPAPEHGATAALDSLPKPSAGTHPEAGATKGVQVIDELICDVYWVVVLGGVGFYRGCWQLLISAAFADSVSILRPSASKCSARTSCVTGGRGFASGSGVQRLVALKFELPLYLSGACVLMCGRAIFCLQLLAEKVEAR